MGCFGRSAGLCSWVCAGAWSRSVKRQSWVDRKREGWNNYIILFDLLKKKRTPGLRVHPLFHTPNLLAYRLILLSFNILDINYHPGSLSVWTQCIHDFCICKPLIPLIYLVSGFRLRRELLIDPECRSGVRTEFIVRAEVPIPIAGSGSNIYRQISVD